MRVVSLASGSSGNALLIEAGPQGRTRLLVDAGLGIRVLTQRLRAVGVQPSQLQGVLVTHEHSDHVLGLPPLARRFQIPIISDPRTLEAIEAGVRAGAWRSDSGRLIFMKSDDTTAATTQVVVTPSTVLVENELTYEQQETTSMLQVSVVAETREAEPAPSGLTTIPLPIGSRRQFGDIDVSSFPISHDAVAPCGYLLQAGGCRVCVATDSGEVTPEMLAAFQQADLLVLEANHDRERLVRGPYPWSLKQRILSPTGHLSNTQTAEAVLRSWPADGVRWLWLAHLSRTNNSPSLALASIRTSLANAGASLDHIHISALPPGMGPVWDSSQLWHMPSLWNLK